MASALPLNLQLALKGVRPVFRVLLMDYAAHQGWSEETLRNRWVGTKALLAWWSSLSDAPALTELDLGHAQLFYQSLAKLSRSTQKAYFKGARSGLQALYRALGFAGYDPWKGFAFPKQPLPAPNLSRVPRYKQHRVIALVYLLNSGYSIPQACKLEWKSYIPAQGRFHGSLRTLTPEVRGWFESKSRFNAGKVVVWRTATARKWLKKVYAPSP